MQSKYQHNKIDNKNKNKSLSSPANNLLKTTNPVRLKPKQLKIKQKYQLKQQNTLKQENRLKKVKLNGKVKQKTISNGSMSTSYTKSGAKKKPKISRKQIQQKMISKSSISQNSNQFLILGTDLYDYQNMQKLNKKSNPKLNNKSQKQKSQQNNHKEHQLNNNHQSNNNNSQSNNNYYQSGNDYYQQNNNKYQQNDNQGHYNNNSNKDKNNCQEHLVSNILNNRQQQNKKVTFSRYQSYQRPKRSTIKSQLSNTNIYDQDKLNKKLKNTVDKIQKYLKTFQQATLYEQSKQYIIEHTQELQYDTKASLFKCLSNDRQLFKLIQKEKRQLQIQQVDQIIFIAFQKVQEKCLILESSYPLEYKVISKWKNSKFHQLQTAKKVLKQMIQDQYKIATRSSLSKQKIIDYQFSKQQRQVLQSEQDLNQVLQDPDQVLQDPDQVLQRQMQIIMSQQYYPQLKHQTLSLRKSLVQLYKNEQYPEVTKIQTQVQISEKKKLQETRNYFTPNGVLWFYQKFFQFIQNKSNSIINIIDRMNQGYGFYFNTKMAIARTEHYQHWFDFFDQNYKRGNFYPIIDYTLLSDFQQQMIKCDPEVNQQLFNYMHHFNVAILDCFNHELNRYRPFYPCGQPIPFIIKVDKFLRIDYQSMQCIFAKCKFHIYSNYITYLAGLIISDNHQPFQVRKYNLHKQQLAVRMDMAYEWNGYMAIMPIAIMSTLQAVYQEIQTQILIQIAIQIMRISKLQKITVKPQLKLIL